MLVPHLSMSGQDPRTARCVFRAHCEELPVQALGGHWIHIGLLPKNASAVRLICCNGLEKSWNI
jgi:hypothetical protein